MLSSHLERKAVYVWYYRLGCTWKLLILEYMQVTWWLIVSWAGERANWSSSEDLIKRGVENGLGCTSRFNLEKNMIKDFACH